MSDDTKDNVTQEEIDSWFEDFDNCEDTKSWILNSQDANLLIRRMWAELEHCRGLLGKQIY